MNWAYHISISSPHTHMAQVRYRFERPSDMNSIELLFPCWSPGSYLMREYARHVRGLRAETLKGEPLFCEKTSKHSWTIEWGESELNNSECSEIEVSYDVYCHEMSVRTSHINDQHAFLHGPSLFLRASCDERGPLALKLSFPPLWSRVTTSLKDLGKGNLFVYEAYDYDDLLDSPIEIGCQETDGFMFEGKQHHIGVFGETYPFEGNLKADIKTLVESISSLFGGVPYERYAFIIHFAANHYGGLEHASSTALQFDGRKLGQRKQYLNWLSLVAHEYFHTWNVKRIRPEELGPFDYQTENYTKMLWLAEGLTSFIDEWLVYRAGLSTLDEYLESMVLPFQVFEQNPGKKFQSLEQSSWDTWVKLYRPTQDSKNSTMSYYLKGAVVFWILHVMLRTNGSCTAELTKALWKHYQARPERGIRKEEFFELLSQLLPEKECERFRTMIETTEDVDLKKYAKAAGLELCYERSEKSHLGVQFDVREGQVFVKEVLLDSSGHKSGLNAGDEVIAVNRQRINASELSLLSDLRSQASYLFTLSRLGKLLEIEVQTEKSPPKLKSIQVADKAKADKVFG